jgi:hypothetical protein
MPIDQALKDAVWLLLEITSQQQPDTTIHSDFVIRKFPKTNEIELINAIGALAQEGKITLKASSVDAHGNATAYHIRVRDLGGKPKAPPPEQSRVAYNVGFGGPAAASSERATTPPEERKRVGLNIEGGKIDILPDTGKIAPQPPPKDPADSGPHSVTIGTGRIVIDKAQVQAEDNFAEEVTSFFAELQAYPVSDGEAKKELMDQLAVIMAMFSSVDIESFTTPISKLATLKQRVQHLAPELVPDYIMLMQSAVRAWLGRV